MTRTARKADMRRNIDAWWPHVEVGVEAIVVTASGCRGRQDYGHPLADDPFMRKKVAKISELCRDPADRWCREETALRALSPMRRNAASWLSARQVRCSMA